MIFIVMLMTATLTGCSSMRIVDSQVQAFSKLESPPAAAASWSFERLPSQQNLQDVQAARQNKLELMVMKALSEKGFAAKPLAAGEPQFTVQISARIERMEAGPLDQPDPWHGRYGLGGLAGRDYVVTGNGRVIYAPYFPRMNPPWYVREVALLIRDAKDKRIVYETQARHEGRWADDEAVLPAMFAAALQSFPKSSDGVKIVNIEIPR